MKKELYQIPPYYTLEVVGESVIVRSYSNRSRGRELKQWLNNEGYLCISINRKSQPLHRIMARAALGERPPGLVINHKDGNKLNNNPNNLEYCTQAYNIEHSIKMGFHVSNNPIRSGRYKDGRAIKERVPQYKNEHYKANIEVYKKRASDYYKNNREKCNAANLRRYHLKRKQLNEEKQS